MIGVLASQFCLCQWEHNFARQCNRINANRFRAKWIANSIPRRVATLCPCRFPSHFRRFVVFATLFMVRVVHPEIGTQAFVRLNVTLVFCDGEQIFEKHLMDKKWMQMWHTAAPACTSKLSRGFNISSVWCNMRLRQMRNDDNTSKFRASISSLCGCSSWLVTLVSHVSTMGQEDVFGLAEAWETWKQKTADMQRTRITSRSLYILGKSWRILRVAGLNFRQHKGIFFFPSCKICSFDLRIFIYYL